LELELLSEEFVLAPHDVIGAYHQVVAAHVEFESKELKRFIIS
jgi:hypothetical protein